MELYEMLQPMIFRHIRFQFYNYGEAFAYDVTSNYLRSLCDRSKTQPFVLSPKKWVLTGADNAAKRLIEKNHYKDTEASEFDFNEVVAAETGHDMIQREIDRETCEIGFAALTDNERLIMEMRYFGDVPLSDVAKQLGLSYDNVKQLHRRAKIKMKNSIENSSEKD